MYVGKQYGTQKGGVGTRDDGNSVSQCRLITGFLRFKVTLNATENRTTYRIATVKISGDILGGKPETDCELGQENSFQVYKIKIFSGEIEASD